MKKTNTKHWGLSPADPHKATKNIIKIIKNIQHDHNFCFKSFTLISITLIISANQSVFCSSLFGVQSLTGLIVHTLDEIKKKYI